MSWLSNKYKREGAIGTALVHALLLLLFVFVGLSYTVPRPEKGILVNFGNSEVGSGDVQPEESGEPEQATAEPVAEQPETQPSTEQVPTQDTEDAPEITQPTDPQPDPVKPTTPEQQPEPEKQQEISNQLSNALNKLRQTRESGQGSEGDDQQAGDKGQTDGSPDGSSYTGAGAGDGDYALGNRKALTRPKPAYTCQEEGKVVIDIKVDRNGKTTSATVGKGTTNTAECLTSRAIQAALRTKWQADTDAPFEQRGKITYHFILK